MKITRPKSLTVLVVDELRARIIDGRLRLGEGLSENALAAELGMSKTPVREALLQLKLERLVDVLPQRGTYVFRLARDEVVMISELREFLELPAAAAAIERNHALLIDRMAEIFQAMGKAFHSGDIARYRARDGEFHQAIIDQCGNPYVSDAYSQIGFRIQALRSRLSDEVDPQPALVQGSRRDAEAGQGAPGCGLAGPAARAYPADHALLSRRSGQSRRPGGDRARYGIRSPRQAQSTRGRSSAKAAKRASVRSGPRQR